MSDITKLKATADILGGSVFYATGAGVDPEYPNNGDLLANGMYIRLEGSDDSIAYISAFEIDKAIGIIGDMTAGKANQADVDALNELLGDKASSIDLELLSSIVDTKADSSAVLDVKSYTDTQVIGLSERIESNEKTASKGLADLNFRVKALESIDHDAYIKLDELNSKVDLSAIESIRKDIDALEAALDSISDSSSITAINNQIEYLNNEIKKRLTIDDLTPLKKDIISMKDVVELNDAKVSDLEIALNKKASTTYVQGQVNELNGAITALSSRVDAKADKANVSNKASKSDLDTVVKKVTGLSASLSDLEINSNANYNDLSAQIALKAAKSDVETAIKDINTSLENKVDKAAYNDTVNKLDSRISNVEDNQDKIETDLKVNISELECELNNNISEIKANLAIQEKTINTQQTQIKSLQEKDLDTEEQLKTQWVRVMTPEAYNRLAPVGSTYNDGTPNPYAKQANVVYMLVRYNKPIAVYIGDVLIAQAEQKGSVGFAYTFPIVF